MSYINLPIKDNTTPLTPTEFNYLVDMLNLRKLRNLIDVQDADAQDKQIIRHNGSGWVYYTITDDHYTKAQINQLLGVQDVGGSPVLTVNWGEIQGTIRNQLDLVANFGDLKASQNIWTGKHYAENYILTGSAESIPSTGTMDEFFITDGFNQVAVTDSDILTIKGSLVDFDFTNKEFNILENPVDGFGYIDFKRDLPSPAHREGRLYWNSERHSLAIYDDELDTELNVGEEQRIRVYNANGSTIINGDIVSVSGVRPEGVIEVERAIASDETSALNTIGIATHDIEIGTYGWVTISGNVNGVDTSAYIAGDAMFLSDSVPGKAQAFRPESPSYEVRMGGIIKSHITDGIMYVEPRIIDNNHSNNAFFNGAILEPNHVELTKNGTTVNISLHSDAINNRLSLVREQDYLSVSDGINVDCILGTDSAPAHNYIYIDKFGIMQASLAGFPLSDVYTPVAKVVVPSALTAQATGVYKVHAYTDHLSASNDIGHLTHINTWIRNRPAGWLSGCALTPSLAEGVSGSTIHLAYSSGVISQLHQHTFPAFDSATSQNLLVVNDSISNYTYRNGISFAIDTDSEGVLIGNKYYNVVLFGVVSEDDSDSHVMMNLPSGSYTNEADALNDIDKHTNYTIPEEYLGTGFLLSQITIKRTNTTVTIVNGGIRDLRGSIPSSGGGGVSGGTGIQKFDELTDTPISKIGFANNLVRVNASENALEYFAGDSVFLPLAGGVLSGTLEVASELKLQGGGGGNDWFRFRTNNASSTRAIFDINPGSTDVALWVMPNVPSGSYFDSTLELFNSSDNTDPDTMRFGLTANTTEALIWSSSRSGSYAGNDIVFTTGGRSGTRQARLSTLGNFSIGDDFESTAKLGIKGIFQISNNGLDSATMYTRFVTDAIGDLTVTPQGTKSTFAGQLYAASFHGDGSNLTGVVSLSSTQTFTGVNTFNEKIIIATTAGTDGIDFVNDNAIVKGIGSVYGRSATSATWTFDNTGNVTHRDFKANSNAVYDIGSDAVRFRDTYLSGVLNSGSVITSALTANGISTFNSDLIIANSKLIKSSSNLNKIEIYNGSNANMNFTVGHATTGLQVFNFITGSSNQMKIAGDTNVTFFNPVTGVAPTVDLHLATKKYVDDNSGSGGRMSYVGGGTSIGQANGSYLKLADITGDNWSIKLRLKSTATSDISSGYFDITCTNGVISGSNNSVDESGTRNFTNLQVYNTTADQYTVSVAIARGADLVAYHFWQENENVPSSIIVPTSAVSFTRTGTSKLSWTYCTYYLYSTANAFGGNVTGSAGNTGLFTSSTTIADVQPKDATYDNEIKWFRVSEDDVISGGLATSEMDVLTLKSDIRDTQDFVHALGFYKDGRNDDIRVLRGVMATDTYWTDRGQLAMLDTNSSYEQLICPSGWLRTPASGLLPDSNNGASLGTASWKFANGYINDVYSNNLYVTTKITGNGTDLYMEGASGKEVVVSSGRNIINIIDNNNDDVDHKFRIQSNVAAWDNTFAADVFSVAQDGTTTAAGRILAPSAEIPTLYSVSTIRRNTSTTMITLTGSTVKIHGDMPPSAAGWDIGTPSLHWDNIYADKYNGAGGYEYSGSGLYVPTATVDFDFCDITVPLSTDNWEVRVDARGETNASNVSIIIRSLYGKVTYQHMGNNYVSPHLTQNWSVTLNGSVYTLRMHGVSGLGVVYDVYNLNTYNHKATVNVLATGRATIGGTQLEDIYYPFYKWSSAYTNYYGSVSGTAASTSLLTSSTSTADVQPKDASFDNEINWFRVSEENIFTGGSSAYETDVLTMRGDARAAQDQDHAFIFYKDGRDFGARIGRGTNNIDTYWNDLGGIITTKSGLLVDKSFVDTNVMARCNVDSSWFATNGSSILGLRNALAADVSIPNTSSVFVDYGMIRDTATTSIDLVLPYIALTAEGQRSVFLVGGKNSDGVASHINSKLQVGNSSQILPNLVTTRTLLVSGTVGATGFYNDSLRIWKKNIKPLNIEATEIIEKVDIVTFDYKDEMSPNNVIGVIADDSPKELLNEEFDAVDLNKTVFLQMKAMQEMIVRIKSLEDKIELMVKELL